MKIIRNNFRAVLMKFLKQKNNFDVLILIKFIDNFIYREGKNIGIACLYWCIWYVRIAMRINSIRKLPIAYGSTDCHAAISNDRFWFSHDISTRTVKIPEIDYNRLNEIKLGWSRLNGHDRIIAVSFFIFYILNPFNL